MPIVVHGLDVAQLTPEHFDTAAEARAFRLGELHGLGVCLEMLGEIALDLEAADEAVAAQATRTAERHVARAAEDRVALWDARGQL